MKEAIRLEPNLLNAHLLLGTTLRQAGSIPDALAVLTKAARLAPENTQCHYQLGLALLEAENPREAANALIRAAAFKPDDTEIQDALAQALALVRAPATSAGEPDDADRSHGTFTGDLKLFSVAELLDFLLNQRATGTLLVRSPKGDGVIELYQGEIVGARHPQGKPLSRQLLDTDVITHTDLKRAVVDPDHLERDRIVASVLATNNLVDKPSLEELLERHVNEALVEMLTWTEGNAMFRREAPGGTWSAPPEIRLDTRWLLINATRQLDEQRTRSGRRPT